MAEDAEELGQIQEQREGELLFFCSSTHPTLHLSSFTPLLHTTAYWEALQTETNGNKVDKANGKKTCIHRSRAEYKIRSCKTIKPSTESPLSRSNLEMMKRPKKKFEPWAELWMTQWTDLNSEIHLTSEPEFSAFSGQILFFFFISIWK